MNLALALVVLGAVADEAPAAAAAKAEAAPVEAAAPATATAPEAPKAEAPAPKVEKDAMSVSAGPVDVKLGAQLRMAQSISSPLLLDEAGTTTTASPFELRFRLAPEIKWNRLSLVSEFDLATGAIFGTPDTTVVAARIPTPEFRAAELRQLFLQYRWDTGAARLGVQTQQFGLGMLSNAGAKDAEPGDFGLQHGGVIVARAGVAARPLFGLGGAWRAVEPVAAFDVVINDTTVKFLEGDRAYQGIIGVRFNVDDEHQLGLTGVYRSARRPDGAPGERSTDVFVVDLFGRWKVINEGDTALTLAAEAAYITGKTTQSRSDTAENLDVRQFGAVAKVNFKKGRLGLLLDGGFASGDQNPYDAQLNNFRFDANYKVGLVLFDQVLGYQTARSGWRAADPQLAGVPPEGIDLLPTAGAITGAWYLFPRAKFSALEWLDVYGGPLFAFTTATLTDPFNTRLGGGTPINYLGARPGNYLGTELDLGVSVHGTVGQYFVVTATLEGGVLLPGDAFKTASGGTMPAAGLGRLRLALQM